jgi:hypothetical protein
MSRRRLWSLTALACVLLILPSLPAGWRWAAFDGVTRLAVSLPAPGPMPAPLAVAAGSLLLATALLVRRLRRPAAEVATRLARRGRPVPVIARRTGLAQDAVRDLLGGDPGVVSAAVEGRFFRRARRTPPPAPDAFAQELRERSFEATA